MLHDMGSGFYGSSGLSGPIGAFATKKGFHGHTLTGTHGLDYIFSVIHTFALAS